MKKNVQPLTPEVRELQMEISGLRRSFGGLTDIVAEQSQTIQSLLITRATTPAAPVSNLLWNGELGHSEFTWNETVGPPTGNKNKECAWFFSHNKPSESRTFQDADVNVGDDSITLTAHDQTTGNTVDLLNTGGGLPAPLVINTTYFVIVVDDNTIKLATTIANAYAGTAINLTSAAAGGTHTIQQKLIMTTAATSTTNNKLKASDHPTYDPRMSRWNSENGWGELCGTTSMDILLPQNLIDATTPLARVGMIATKRNRYIEISNDCRFGCGIWDNTSGQRKFLTGDVGLSVGVIGTLGTTERRYRVLLRSDRGFSILSDEVIITDAPSDIEFSPSRYITMSWSQQAGQLKAEIYEHIPSLGEYRLVTEVSSGTSYIHYGGFLRTAPSYPSSTNFALTATFFTRTGEMAGLSTKGISPTWATVIFPNAVPRTYNKANTTDRQWVRMWLTKAPNLVVQGITSDGSTVITAPAASATLPTAFEEDYDDIYNSGDLEFGLYQSDGTLMASGNVLNRVSDTQITLDATIAADSDLTLRIIGAGFHGVLVDKVHLGYQSNTSYAPNAMDARTLQPVAAPSSGDQGGVGLGGGGEGGGGGIILCIADDTPVKLASGEWEPIRDRRAGEMWDAGHRGQNLLVHLKQGYAHVRRVRAANGCEIICTDTERFLVDHFDESGRPLWTLRVGDRVLTEIDGRYDISRLTEISDVMPTRRVVTPTLSDSHIFIAGTLRPSFWTRIKSLFTLHKRRRKGGFVLHNNKLPPLIENYTS